MPKLFKLWVEIEEIDAATGDSRDLSSEGEASPVPVAVLPTLEEAMDLAEAMAIDREVDRLKVS